MQEIIIDGSFGKGRVDKCISRLLPGIPKNLMYKQMRNKNITLNGHKIKGDETAGPGDVLRFFFSDETFDKFRTGDSEELSDNVKASDEYVTTYREHRDEVRIVYENDHIIIMDKPVGMMSQKSKESDLSLNEWMLGYLLESGSIEPPDMLKYKPSVLNRLDTNTTGLVIGGKTHKAAVLISEALRDRTIHKYYKTVVWGDFTLNDGVYEAEFSKNESTNTVNILTKTVNTNNPSPKAESGKYDIIRTGIKKTGSYNISHLDTVYGIKAAGSDTSDKQVSELEIELITGKSHQIRAHLSAMGYPIVGDPKYGDKTLDRKYFGKNDHYQSLDSYKIVFNEEICEALGIEPGTIIKDR